MYTVGIDLGTTFSSVGVYANGKVNVIRNDENTFNSERTPSYVAFTDDDGILIGEPAKDYFLTNPKNCIYDSKRLIGKTYNDKTVEEDMENWSFEIIGINNKPNIKLIYQSKPVEYEPKYISAQILIKLKQIALRYLNCKPNEILNAVITVPANFNQSQRKETMEAAELAGIQVLQLLHEPTAATIAYAFDENFQTKKNIMCFDFGGGTLDVSIVSINNGNSNVLATSGDTHLGGQDIDNALVDYVIRLMSDKYKIEVEALKNKKEVKYYIKEACEKAKRRLTTSDKVYIHVKNLCKNVDGTDFTLNESISKTKFESIVEKILDKTLNSVRKALEIAGFKKDEIDEVILAGGSSKIPYVKKLLEEFFGKNIKYDIDPDLAIVHGAAIYAGTFNGNVSFVDLSINDILPLSIGMEEKCGEMTIVIPRGTKIPHRIAISVSNILDNQTLVKIPIYEGERVKVSDNNFLGELKVNIDPCPRDTANINTTFEINKNGLISIEATYKKNKRFMKLETNYNVGKINSILSNAKKFESTDQFIKEACEIRRKLENYCYKMIAKLSELETENPLIDRERLALIEYLTDKFNWCVNDPICDKENYEKELYLCQSYYSSLLDSF